MASSCLTHRLVENHLHMAEVIDELMRSVIVVSKPLLLSSQVMHLHIAIVCSKAIVLCLADIFMQKRVDRAYVYTHCGNRVIVCHYAGLKVFH